MSLPTDDYGLEKGNLARAPKISELIAQLEELKERQGDLPVMTPGFDEYPNLEPIGVAVHQVSFIPVRDPRKTQAVVVINFASCKA